MEGYHVEDSDDDDEELVYDDLLDDLREAGAIPVLLREVRNAMGRNREKWETSMDNQLQT